MRILILAINYWPEKTGNAIFVTGRADYLASRGHDVTVCTGFPYYPEWRVGEEYRRRLFAREERNGVKIVRSYLYVPRQVTTMRRVVHEASFVASNLFTALGSERPDVLLVISAPLALGVSGFMLSRLWRIPHVFHVQDMQPDAAGDLNMLPAPVIRVLYRLERFAYERATLVSALTEGMRRRIIAKGIAADKVEVFSHCAEQDLFETPPESAGAEFRQRHGLMGKFLVLHAGNMGVKQGLGAVVSAAELSREDPEIHYLLVGDGAERPALEQRVKTLGLPNVTFLPLQRRDTFRSMLSESGVCLVTEKRSIGDILFPGKMLTYMTAGRAVIAAVDGDSEAARVARESGAGPVVPSEDPRALFDAILEVRGDERMRRAMGTRARAYARAQWDPPQVLGRMEARLEQLAATARSRAQAA